MLRYPAALVFWLAIGSANALACSCVEVEAQLPCGLLKKPSEVVFVGTLLFSENPPEPEDRQLGGQAHYRFRVDESFSASTAKEIDVYSGRGVADCSASFNVGEQYLVDAWRGEDGQVSVSICSKTRRFSEYDPLIPVLRAIRDGKNPASLFGVLRRMQEPWGGASDPDYNKPLAGRTLSLSSGQHRFEATTDSNGNYKFDALPAGDYSVSADLPPKLVLGELILHRPMPTIKVVDNACGEYDLNALPTGRIGGRVINATGNGVSGWDAAPLELFRRDRYKPNAYDWTDRGWWNFPKEGGYFVFDHVAPGDYVLVFNSSAQSPYLFTFYPSGTDVEHATAIHVGDGQEVKDIVFRVARRPATP